MLWGFVLWIVVTGAAYAQETPGRFFGEEVTTRWWVSTLTRASLDFTENTHNPSDKLVAIRWRLNTVLVCKPTGPTDRKSWDVRCRIEQLSIQGSSGDDPAEGHRAVLSIAKWVRSGELELGVTETGRIKSYRVRDVDYSTYDAQQKYRVGFDRLISTVFPAFDTDVHALDLPGKSRRSGLLHIPFWPHGLPANGPLLHQVVEQDGQRVLVTETTAGAGGGWTINGNAASVLDEAGRVSERVFRTEWVSERPGEVGPGSYGIVVRIGNAEKVAVPPGAWLDLDAPLAPVTPDEAALEQSP